MSGRLKCSEPKRLRCYRLVRMSYDDDISTNYRQMSKCRLSLEPAIPSSLSAGKTSFASEETSSGATSTRISPSSEPSQERNELRQLGVALAAGGEALSRFRGSTIENEEGKDRFNPPMPGMDCSVDRIANYVSCYGSAIRSKEEASEGFIRLINELHVVLPSDRWRGIETEPEIDSIRSYTYEDRNSDARIDIDLIGQLEMEGDYSYLIAIFGWAATEPRL
jgi:hypothetical protein